jgi:hypothetical protein
MNAHGAGFNYQSSIFNYQLKRLKGIFIMATSRTVKIDAEILKVRAKISEQQDKLRELEKKRTECENMEIVDIVRGMNVPLDELVNMLQALKSEPAKQGQSQLGQSRLGQVVPIETAPVKKETKGTT